MHYFSRRRFPVRFGSARRRRQADAALGLLLETMQYVNKRIEFDRVDGTIRVAVSRICDELADARKVALAAASRFWADHRIARDEARVRVPPWRFRKPLQVEPCLLA